MRILLNRGEYRGMRWDVRRVADRGRLVGDLRRDAGFGTISAAASDTGQSSPSLHFELHVRNEQQAAQGLIQQGRRIRTVQSAKKNPAGEYLTRIYSGYTASPDLITEVTTGRDGSCRVRHKKLYSRK